MKENIKQKINEWAQKFNQDKTEETLEKIFIELSNFSDEAESTQVEKLVVLINQCIILDTLNTDNYKIENNVYTRNDIVEGIKVIYEEFIQSSVIDEWENESTIAFKEYVSYIIALILYKVNNYEEAYKYFGESRKFSTQLDNVENPNGLDSLSQIKRDIYFAYCCEYIGTPLMNYERLAEALQILLGTKAEIENYRQYWHQLKVECYDCISEINRAFSSNDDLEKKTKKIINSTFPADISE